MARFLQKTGVMQVTPFTEPAIAAGVDAPIARLVWATGRVAHCVLAAWEADEVESVSEPASVGVAFSHQDAAVIKYTASCRFTERFVAAGSIGLCGPEPIAWVRTTQASDTVEISAPVQLRRELATSMGVPSSADLDDLHGFADPVVVGAASRLRASCRGWAPLDDLAHEALIRAVYGRIYQLRFGGRFKKAPRGALVPARLVRVIEFANAHLDRPLTLSDLAAQAALSPSHFAHAFKVATGSPPHRFIATLRLLSAAERLRQSRLSVEHIAGEVGYSNMSHFRRSFLREFGHLPSQLRPRD